GDEKYVRVSGRAAHDYLIEDTLEAGMQLTGTEVKVLRQGLASIAEAYASDEGGEIYLINVIFPVYPAARLDHEPRRKRRLLLHRREINKLLGAIKREGMTVIPLA